MAQQTDVSTKLVKATNYCLQVETISEARKAASRRLRSLAAKTKLEENSAPTSMPNGLHDQEFEQPRNKTTKVRTSIRIDEILISDGHRPVREDFVEILAASFQVAGLIEPLLVFFDGSGRMALLAGRQRLAAAKKLGWPCIDAIIIDADEVDRRIRALASDLHRLELNRLERAEREVEWMHLVLAKEGQSARPVGGQQPGDRGLSKAGRKLKTSRRSIGRSEQIASICREAKQKIMAAGLENHQASLLAIAKMTTAESQIQKVAELVASKGERSRSSSNRADLQESAAVVVTVSDSMHERKAAPPLVENEPKKVDLEIPLGLLRNDEQILSRLTATWQEDTLRAMLLQVSPDCRRVFLRDVVIPELAVRDLLVDAEPL